MNRLRYNEESDGYTQIDRNDRLKQNGERETERERERDIR